MPRSDGSIVIDTTVLTDGFSKGLGSLKSMAAGAGKAIGVGIAGATVALGAFSVAAVKAAEEDRAGNERIRAIAESMGLFGDQTNKVTDRLTALATKTALATGVDDGLIKSTQAKLLTFKDLAKTADEAGGAFDRATQAAIDMAAAGFGEADSNAVQLGKALQDPIKGITALAKSGVTFTDAEKAKIKTLVESNRTLEAQDMILKAVETQVGGTAEATASNSERMKVAFGELTESAGGPLLAAFDALAPALMKGLQELQPILEQTFGGLGKMLSGDISGAADFEQGISGLVDKLATGIETALPIVITALTSLLTSLATMLPSIIEKITPALVEGLSSIVEALPQILPALTAALLDLFIALSTELGAMMPTLVPMLAEAILLMVDQIVLHKQEFIEAAQMLIAGLAVGLWDALPSLLEAIVNLAAALLSMIGQLFGINSPSTVFAEIGGYLIAGLVQGLQAAWSAVASFFGALRGRVLAFFASAGAWLVAKGKALLDGFKAGITTGWNTVKAFISGLPAKIKSGIGDLSSKWTDAGRSLVTGLWAGINDKFNWLVGMLKGFANNVKDRLKGFFGIKSPSRVFEDEIGMNLGLALGTDRGFGRGVTKAVAQMQRTISGEMARFGSVAVPATLQGSGGTVVHRGGDTVIFQQPVRTYSEVLRARRDIERGLAR